MAKHSKPAKPRPDFPLYPHASGRWAKRINGKIHYFGKWADSDAALKRYLDEKDDLYAGRKPRSKRAGLNVQDLCDSFLHAKKARVASGEIKEITWRRYRDSCKLVKAAFGGSRLVSDLAPDDFATLRASIAENRRLVTLAGIIVAIRSTMKYAYDAGLIDRPVRYGTSFDLPSPQSVRRQRTPKMMERGEINKLLASADPLMKALILCAVNTGMGASDLQAIPKSAVDLAAGWLDFARVKTGIARRIPLWPETVNAIRESLATRKGDSDRLFVNMHGRPLQKTAVFKRFTAVSAAAGVRKPNVGFYVFRHVFETIAGESADQVAVNAVMGHAPERGDMSAHYRERVSDERLQRVVNTVRDWLFTEPAAADAEPAIVKFRTVG